MPTDNRPIGSAPVKSRQTLDQVRAALAWGYATKGMEGKEAGKYKNLAKGAPALIMNSGLMATLAYYKSKKEAGLLLSHLIEGLTRRLGSADKQATKTVTEDFRQTMADLHAMNGQDYMRWTNEALELLKWIRQYVDAQPSSTGDK